MLLTYDIVIGCVRAKTPLYLSMCAEHGRNEARTRI